MGAGWIAALTTQLKAVSDLSVCWVSKWVESWKNISGKNSIYIYIYIFAICIVFTFGYFWSWDFDLEQWRQFYILIFWGWPCQPVLRNRVQEFSCGMDVDWEAENRNSQCLWRPNYCRLSFVAWAELPNHEFFIVPQCTCWRRPKISCLYYSVTYWTS